MAWARPLCREVMEGWRAEVRGEVPVAVRWGEGEPSGIRGGFPETVRQG